MFKVLRGWVQRYFSDEEAVVLAVLLVLAFTAVLTLGGHRRADPGNPGAAAGDGAPGRRRAHCRAGRCWPGVCQRHSADRALGPGH